MVHVCDVCGARLRYKGTGMPARYCRSCYPKVQRLQYLVRRSKPSFLPHRRRLMREYRKRYPEKIRADSLKSYYRRRRRERALLDDVLKNPRKYLDSI